jgi:hypothetical protein
MATSNIPGQFLNPAQISVGTISNDATESDQASLLVGGDVGGPWTDYMVFNRYTDNVHTYQLPVTSPDGFGGDTAAFVQLAAGTLVLAVEWTAARWGAQPYIPDPDLSNSDWVFLGKKPETAMAPLGPDGVTPLYRISGTYFYGHRKPDPKTLPNMVFPRPAWCQDAFDRSVPASILKQGIIDGGGKGGGKGGSNNGLLTGFVVTA